MNYIILKLSINIIWQLNACVVSTSPFLSTLCSRNPENRVLQTFSGLPYCFVFHMSFSPHWVSCLPLLPISTGTTLPSSNSTLPSKHLTILEVSPLTSIRGLSPVSFALPLHFVSISIFSVYYIVYVYPWTKVE